VAPLAFAGGAEPSAVAAGAGDALAGGAAVAAGELAAGLLWELATDASVNGTSAVPNAAR
jgi:hypothetical protein